MTIATKAEVPTSLRPGGCGIEIEEGRDRQEITTLGRFLKFNFVGGIGVFVQFVALFLLKGVLRLPYLAATAVAVEAAVMHNFVWHEQFTWVDRLRIHPGYSKRVGLKESRSSMKNRRWLGWPGSLRRFFRFQVANGAVSLIGNLALMKVMVGFGHMNYLVANAIAIALCSVANFLVSDEWVFAEGS